VSRFCRKALLLVAFSVALVCNLTLGLLTTLAVLEDFRDPLILALVCLLVSVIGICQEPVTSLYMTETGNNATNGLVTLFNNLFYLGYSYLLPLMITEWPRGPTMFMINAGVCLMALVYIGAYLRETKGLSDVQKKSLYSKI
jgi:hypothetical protein